MKQRERLNESIGKANRSKVTNASSLFHGDIDGRSSSARRWRDVHDALMQDLGGMEKLTSTQKLLCRNLASMQLSAELMESELLEGSEDYDAAAHARLIGTINRTLETLNPTVKSKKMKDPRDFDGSLEQYIASPEVQERLRKQHASHKCTPGCFVSKD